ncbi:hypothetical protein K788_00025690 (plasmid) [Paraburkholderia caribensis MBA4]|uniref:Uncharacterized protein n=1 Tax=Paraburkholderia caribensis MBA4 TaxID=1323664 RepID=A0A0P0RLG9_9BURK|nr:hypothetical protein K788_00025690 [Paraburkholderia caribensis MBA4]
MPIAQMRGRGFETVEGVLIGAIRFKSGGTLHYARLIS